MALFHSKRKAGFRSIFEYGIDCMLKKAKVEHYYESEKIPYIKPATNHYYMPDWKIITQSGKVIYIEAKGRFLSSDRAKHRLIKKQRPDLDIRFVFMNINEKITKKSKTTYGDWCKRYGFTCAAKRVPKEWLEE